MILDRNPEVSPRRVYPVSQGAASDQRAAVAPASATSSGVTAAQIPSVATMRAAAATPTPTTTVPTITPCSW
jgi:hypothetical protein